jgi:methionyl-tRNA synthetase
VEEGILMPECAVCYIPKQVIQGFNCEYCEAYIEPTEDLEEAQWLDEQEEQKVDLLEELEDQALLFPVDNEIKYCVACNGFGFDEQHDTGEDCPHCAGLGVVL